MESGSHRDSHSPSSPDGPSPTDTKTLLFVGGLPAEACNLTLQKHFSRFGHIQKVEIQCSDSGKSKGYGFITLTDPTAVEAILKEQVHKIMGKQITVAAAHNQDEKRNERISVTNRKIFIGGLPASMSITDISSFVSQFAQVVKLSKPRFKADGTQYCVAFVDKLEQARKLLKLSPIKLARFGCEVEFSPYVPPKLQKTQRRIPNIGSHVELKQSNQVSLPKTISLKQIAVAHQQTIPIKSFTDETESPRHHLHQKMNDISDAPKSIPIRRRLRLEFNKAGEPVALAKQTSLDQVGCHIVSSSSPLLKDEGYRFNLKYSPKRTRSAQN